MEMKMRIEIVAKTVKEAISGAAGFSHAAARIKKMLTERHGLEWCGDVNSWLQMLCVEWHGKTPYVDAQAAGIAGVIMRHWKVCESTKRSWPLGDRVVGGSEEWDRQYMVQFEKDGER